MPTFRPLVVVTVAALLAGYLVGRSLLERELGLSSGVAFVVSSVVLGVALVWLTPRMRTFATGRRTGDVVRHFAAGGALGAMAFPLVAALRGATLADRPLLTLLLIAMTALVCAGAGALASLATRRSGDAPPRA